MSIFGKAALMGLVIFAVAISLVPVASSAIPQVLPEQAPKVAVSLPDLAIVEKCPHRIVIRNIGGAAGAFDVQIGEGTVFWPSGNILRKILVPAETTRVSAGLKPGAWMIVWVKNTYFHSDRSVTLDSRFELREHRESNNTAWLSPFDRCSA
jgi:hypothetical protein